MKAYFWILTTCGLALSPLGAQGLDADGDGIYDEWETAIGLNPQDPQDAFQDPDGDRVPTLWEYSKNTSPVDSDSVPTFDAVVDGAEPSNPEIRRFATLQEAYDSLPGGADGLAIVDVKPGLYLQGVNGSQSPKRVAWLARSGGVLLKGTGSSMILSDETVIDGFVFSAAAGDAAAGIEITPHADLGNAIPEVRVVNCIVSNRVSTGAAGGIVNDGGNLWVVQTTIAGNAGSEADGVLNRRGSLHLVNSVIWNTKSGKLQEVINRSGDDSISTNDSVIRGSFGELGSDPKLTRDGHLTKGSLACIQHGRAGSGAPLDLHLARRPGGDTPADLGAEQWMDSDDDGLPDWWERLHFNDTKHDGAAQAGRGLTLAQAYILGVVPATSLLAATQNPPSVRIIYPADGSVVR